MPEQQPAVLHGAGELGQGWQRGQGLLGAQHLGSGLRGQRTDLLLQLRARAHASWNLAEGLDQGAEVSMEQSDPLDRLGPQVQLPLLKQEVVFILLQTREKTAGRSSPPPSDGLMHVP